MSPFLIEDLLVVGFDEEELLDGAEGHAVLRDGEHDDSEHLGDQLEDASYVADQVHEAVDDANMLVCVLVHQELALEHRARIVQVLWQEMRLRELEVIDL